MSAQSATDAYQVTQHDLKGTARFGHGRSVRRTPAETFDIVAEPCRYRVFTEVMNSGFTLSILRCPAEYPQHGCKQYRQSDKVLSKQHRRRGHHPPNSSAVPTLNIGFTYNKAASFDRRYLKNPHSEYFSSNYIAESPTLMA